MFDTFYALRIITEDGWVAVEHVSNYSDDTIHTDCAELPHSEWRKSHHLTDWVKENLPLWKIEEFSVSYENFFDTLYKKK